MAQPPRLKEILLDPNEPIVYFITLCVEARLAVLANAETFNAIQLTLEQMRRWRTIGGVVMPDHLHVIVTPTQDRSLPVSDFSTGFKRLLRKSVPHQWKWQSGCFDRLLRSEDNLQDKWTYVRDNPVRAGLVDDIQEWPYYVGPIAEQVFVGEAVSFPDHERGNLTGSPTVDHEKRNLTGSPTVDHEEGKLAASPTEAG